MRRGDYADLYSINRGTMWNVLYDFAEEAGLS